VGAAKVAAGRIGISLAEYRTHTDAGRKWCTGCKVWHPREDFAIDRTRGDGLTAVCRNRRNTDLRNRYTPKPRPEVGRRFADARDQDKKQARRRINYLIDAGVLPDPNDVRCTDCAHEWAEGERRHEYDHYLGYAAQHHEDVEAVCSRCHHAREARRTA
jgi:hypothetical protein